jgi:hypothetical protein
MTRSASLYFNGGGDDFSASAPLGMRCPIPMTKSTTCNQINQTPTRFMYDLTNSNNNMLNGLQRQNQPKFFNSNAQSQSFLSVGGMLENKLLHNISCEQIWLGSSGHLNKTISRPIHSGATTSTNGIENNQPGCHFHKQPSQWPTMGCSK